MPATVDVPSSIGLVILAGDDELRLRADYKAVKRLAAQLEVESALRLAC